MGEGLNTTTPSAPIKARGKIYLYKYLIKTIFDFKTNNLFFHTSLLFYLTTFV